MVAVTDRTIYSGKQMIMLTERKHSRGITITAVKIPSIQLVTIKRTYSLRNYDYR